MILGVLLCCVIGVQIEAGIIQPNHIMEQDHKANPESVRETNDVYGAETTQLNGRSPRASSWPEASSITEKMFLLPKTLEVGDEINITILMSRNKNWMSMSLMAEQEGPNGTQPDYNNVASQLYMNFDSNEGNGSVVLKIIKDGITEEYPTEFTPSALIPELQTHTISEVTITMHMVASSNGFNGIELYVGESYLEKISLKHDFNDIRLIILDGAVEKVKKLDFTFG